MRFFYVVLWVIGILQCTPLIAYAQDSKPKVGVFYYPGWRNNVLGNVSPTPWASIRKFPEREPLLGYYDDGDVNVVNTQLGWMADAGLDFVVLDWYWNHKLGILHPQTITAYFQAPNRSRVRMSILWANHTEFPQGRAEFDRMVRFWLYYFRTPEYMKIDQRPVVFIFSTTHLEEKAKAFGSTSAELLESAQKIAREAGLPGIHFVGGAGANSPVVRRQMEGVPSGYAAFSSYNYHGPGTYRIREGANESHTFAELDNGYRDHWHWMLNEARVPYIVPMTAGWDKRPWGGSTDPLHDQSMPTPQEFETHLTAAKRVITTNGNLTKGLGVICCWNEFGEGSYIEPTRAAGFEFLRRFAKVFSPAALHRLPADAGDKGVVK